VPSRRCVLGARLLRCAFSRDVEELVRCVPLPPASCTTLSFSSSGPYGRAGTE
jgi:hypothetical protein